MLAKLSGKKVTNFLIWLSIFTASFDIFLEVDIFGYTVRISQLLMMVVMLIFLADIIKTGKIIAPIGYVNICICTVLNAVFVFHSKNFANAFSYAIWFFFSVFEILVIAHFLVKQESIENLLKKYIDCFVFMSCIGLLQVVLQIFHINFFVTQVTSMHRSNGFSYEPSYYATYLLMGWTICMYLLEKSNYAVMSRRKLAVSTCVITLAIITSTSRMGWLMMGGYIVVRSVVVLFFQKGRKLNIWKFLLLLVLVGCAGLVVYAIYGIAAGNPKILKYVDGLGIGGMANHSSSQRIQLFLETLEVFKGSPFLGYSIGGVAPELCENLGIAYNSGLNGLTMNIFAELLAALGGIGFLFFLRYLYLILWKGYKRLRAFLVRTDKEILAAVIASLLMEMIILQMNQNILRQSLWVHIGIISAVYYMMKKRTDNFGEKYGK